MPDSSGRLCDTPLDFWQNVAERLAAENRSIRGELEHFLAKDTTQRFNPPMARSSLASRRNGMGSVGSPSKAVDGALGGENGDRGDRSESTRRGPWGGDLQAQVHGMPLLHSTIAHRKHFVSNLGDTRGQLTKGESGFRTRLPVDSPANTSE